MVRSWADDVDVQCDFERWLSTLDGYQVLILHLRTSGLNHRQIADRVGYSHSAISWQLAQLRQSYDDFVQ